MSKILSFEDRKMYEHNLRIYQQAFEESLEFVNSYHAKMARIDAEIQLLQSRKESLTERYPLEGRNVDYYQARIDELKSKLYGHDEAAAKAKKISKLQRMVRELQRELED